MRKNNQIISNKPSLLFKKALFNYCLVVLFALIFSWVQFSVFASQPQVKNFRTDGYAVLHTTASANCVQLNASLPFQSLPMGQEMEIQEEDETKNDLNACWDQIIRKYTIGDFFYTTTLRSRFLQITNSLNKRPSILFFILYHSWKGYLS